LKLFDLWNTLFMGKSSFEPQGDVEVVQDV